MSIDIVTKTTQSDPTMNFLVPKDKLGKEDFLQLLVTQLRYQDPTNPMSNEQFISQTAQFSALEQMQELNTNIKSMMELQKTSTRTSAFELIGKKVAANTSTFAMSDKSSAVLDYSLPKDATSVIITIFDANQNVVKSVNLENQSAGSYSLTWDGMAINGTRAKAGNYTYEVTAKGTDGNDVGISNKMISGIVDGVSIKGDEPSLTIGGSSFPLSAVTKILLNSKDG